MLELIKRYRQKSPSATLSGNELALYLILCRTRQSTIKVTGKRMEFGQLVDFHDIICIKNGQLDSHMSYASLDLTDYEQTTADMILKLDNVNADIVVQEFINVNGLL
mgnify:FL=1